MPLNKFTVAAFWVVGGKLFHDLVVDGKNDLYELVNLEWRGLKLPVVLKLKVLSLNGACFL